MNTSTTVSSTHIWINLVFLSASQQIAQTPPSQALPRSLPFLNSKAKGGDLRNTDLDGVRLDAEDAAGLRRQGQREDRRRRPRHPSALSSTPRGQVGNPPVPGRGRSSDCPRVEKRARQRFSPRKFCSGGGRKMRPRGGDLRRWTMERLRAVFIILERTRSRAGAAWSIYRPDPGGSPRKGGWGRRAIERFRRERNLILLG